MAPQRKYVLASEGIRQELDDILSRPGRTSKRQQHLLTCAIVQPGFQRLVWPEEYRLAGTRTRSDIVLYEKIIRAINTGRITRSECQSLAERLFGTEYRTHFDAVMNELDRVLLESA